MIMCSATQISAVIFNRNVTTKWMLGILFSSFFFHVSENQTVPNIVEKDNGLTPSLMQRKNDGETKEKARINCFKTS